MQLPCLRIVRHTFLTAFAFAATLTVRAQLQPLTWTVTSPNGLEAWSENMAGLAFGNNRFLAAGGYSGISSGARITTSGDLVNWTRHTLPPGIPPTALGQEYMFTSAAFGNGMFIVGAWGRPSANTQKILTSSDNGETWTPRDVKLADVWGLDYVNGLWIAAGNSNQSGRTAANLATSTDGINWTLRVTGSGDDLNAAAYGNGRYVAVGNNMQVVHSTDGINWTYNVVNDPDIHLRDITFAAGRFVAAAEGGRIFTSTDGLTWTRINVAPTAIRLRGIAYGGGRFVAVGDTTSVSSADGLSWTVDTTGLRLAHTVVYANSVFAIGADFGTIYRSGTPVFAGPTITAQPQAVSAVAGGAATFSVTASGAANRYQWRKDGVAITGATATTLTLTNITAANAGTYSVVITNADGSITSSGAILTLVSASAAGRIINLSIMTAVGPGDDNFSMGYVVGGAGTSGAKPLVIRAAGPSLGAAFGVGGVNDDPKIELIGEGAKIGENDNWDGSAALAAALSGVGAFPYTGPTSRDAAASVNVTTRNNSVKVSAGGSATTRGTVLAEVYDATPSTSYTAATPRLINVSVIKPIGDLLTAGFVIGGSTSKTVLIRAIGPTLGTAFGMGGVVADPQLTVYGSGRVKITENDNWGGGATLANAFSAVGAFTLPANSRDAAVLVTLQPGSYAVEVTGIGGTGTGLVEVYDVP